mmetsp:Transcript_20368/g.28215  ORF Transcript_20368/g.28215 Transcript_20368/m.28215 type:complete len:283 (+) Transcript_20368:275-1123(+)
MYKAGLEVLNKDIYEADPEKTGIVPRDFLLYCYYGGMIYIGLKQWSKALELFLHAISAPTVALSAITVEAFKKYSVVALIHHGRVPPFPKYTSSVVQRHLKLCAQPYTELETAYITRKMDVLKAAVEKHSAAFVKDKNLGLVKQCLNSLCKRNIQQLTQTYLTLSLEDIASEVGLVSSQDVEMQLLRMIDAKEIHASINQKDGMVSFSEDPEEYNSAAMLARMDKEVQNMMQIAQKVAQVDNQVSCSHAYVTKMMMKDRQGNFVEQEYFEDMGTTARNLFGL